jgi:hypothetical protein
MASVSGHMSAHYGLQIHVLDRQGRSVIGWHYNDHFKEFRAVAPRGAEGCADLTLDVVAELLAAP